MKRAHSWGSVLCNCKHVASLEHTHYEYLASCKLRWHCCRHTGVPQLFHLLILLSLALAGFSALRCGLWFLLPSTLLCLLVKPAWCAGTVGPLKLLGCKCWVHLPFCILQLPGLWAFSVVLGFFIIIGRKFTSQNGFGQTWLSSECTALHRS